MFAKVRLLFVILCCLLGLPFQGNTQQSSSRPKKILTPEQEKFQQELGQYRAQRQGLQAEANQVFDAEIAREGAGDCPDAKSTHDFNVCYAKETGITRQNLEKYEGGIRKLLALQYPVLRGQTPPNTRGPAGPILTEDQQASEFDKLNQAWRSYLDAACTAAFHQFDGGTGGPSFEMECKLGLMRNHMHELDSIYELSLHN